MFKKLFLNTSLLILIIYSISPGFACLDDFTTEEQKRTNKIAALPKIPLQSTQISACLGFAQDTNKDSTDNLFSIAQKNFQHVESIILNRFGEESNNYKKFVELSAKSEKLFSTQKMTLKELAKIYFQLVTECDLRANRNGRYISLRLEEIERNFLHPVPVISQRGIGNHEKLSDLISSGFYYLGIPLAEDVEFDGEKSHPQRFAAHELFHADYLTVNLEITQKTFQFLKRLDDDLKQLSLTPQDKELIQIIRFRAYHENTGTTLFRFLAEPSSQNFGELLSYQEFAVRVLNEGMLDLKSGGNQAAYTFCKDFIPYVEKKNFMEFPAGRDLDQKTPYFANEFNSKIHILKALFSLDGKWGGLARDKIQSEIIPFLQKEASTKKLSQVEILEIISSLTELYPYQWSLLKDDCGS